MTFALSAQNRLIRSPLLSASTTNGWGQKQVQRSKNDRIENSQKEMPATGSVTGICYVALYRLFRYRARHVLFLVVSLVVLTAIFQSEILSGDTVADALISPLVLAVEVCHGTRARALYFHGSTYHRPFSVCYNAVDCAVLCRRDHWDRRDDPQGSECLDSLKTFVFHGPYL